MSEYAAIRIDFTLLGRGSRGWSGRTVLLLLWAVGSLVAHLVTGKADDWRERGVGFLCRLLTGVACFSLILASIDPVA